MPDTLAESQARLDSVLSSLAIVLFEVNPDGRFRYICGRGLDQLGVRPEEVLGKRPEEAFPELPSAAVNIQRALRGESFATTVEAGARKFECHYQAVRDADGQVVKVVGIALDITDRILAEQSRRDTEERYRVLFEDAPVAYHEIDARGVICRVNKAECRLLGLGATDLLGRPVWELVSPEGREASRAAVLRKLAGEQELVPLEREYLRSDGSRVPLEIHENLICDSTGRITGIRSALFDISERVRAAEQLRSAMQQAEEANRAKSDFLANMSHEIRTPMNAIIGMSGLLLDTPLNEEQRGFARTIRDAADSLLTVINDILDFSKIEAGKLDIEPSPFDLGLALDEVCDLMAPKAQDKGLEFLLRVSSRARRRAFGDAGRIRQVLLNLLGNAIKFTDKGYVLLDVDATSDLPGETGIRFSVRDTGIGIPPEKISRLFSRFSQLDSSSTRRYSGTGLGLAISRQLVELMGGQMAVESSEGVGSTFSFTLNLPRVDEPEPPATLPETLAGLRVLVVDDLAVNRLIVRELCESWDMLVTEAASAAEGLSLLRQAAAGNCGFGLAILDHQMPDVDGGQLASNIRRDPRLRDLPLVMLSSSGLRRDDPQHGRLQVDVCLTKPVKPSTLFNALLEAVGRATDQQACSWKPHSAAAFSNPAEWNGRFAGRRVLLAEDNAVNQKVGIKILERLGCRVDVAADGREAVQMAASFPYDLILMDCQMPEVDGYQATASIRILENGARHTPIIAMTANAMKGDREKCLQAGMDDYISKPVRLQELVNVLDWWARQNSPR